MYDGLGCCFFGLGDEDEVDSEAVQTVLELVVTANAATLHRMSQIVVDQLKHVQRRAASVATYSLDRLRRGTKVIVNQPHRGRCEATLLDVRRTRVLVQFPDDPRHWTVPANWIEVP